MATQVLTNAYALVNSVDLSNHLRRIELTQGVGAEDATAMGASPLTKIMKPSLLTGSIKLTFLQDYTAGSVDATLSAALGSTIPIELRGVNTTVGVNNPKWTGTVFITSYNPIAGEVGGMQTCEATFELASALTRAIA